MLRLLSEVVLIVCMFHDPRSDNPQSCFDVKPNQFFKVYSRSYHQPYAFSLDYDTCLFFLIGP